MRFFLCVLLPLSACAGDGHGSAPEPEANEGGGGSDLDGEAFDWPGLAAVDEAILAVMAEDHVPGLAACIIEGETIAWCQGYGWADIAAERPVDADTPFLLASLSKGVTATALVQAAEAGHLDLDGDVDQWLSFAVDHPEAPSAELSSRMLLAHAGGIGDNWDLMDDSYTDGGDSPIGLGDFLGSYLAQGGSRYDADENFVGSGPKTTAEYSNVGAALAGHMVEASSGVAFDAWCEDEIFEPLGMSHTAWFLAQLPEEEVALPYEWWKGDYDRVGHYGFPDYPSGQLRASVTDVARFMRVPMNGGAVLGREILSPGAQAEMLAPAYPGLDPDQGLGWYRWTLDGEEVWGHNGGEWGASTEALWWPETGRGVVVLMNAEGTGKTLTKVERVLRDAVLP